MLKDLNLPFLLKKLNQVYNKDIQAIFEQDVKFSTGELSKEDILNIILKADLFTLNDPA